MAFPSLTPYGAREMILAGLIAAVLVAGAFALRIPWLAIVPVVLYAWVLAFFRHPVRVPPGDPKAVLSPADGRVTHVNECEEPSFVEGRAIMIGIFLSIFDVHLNRAPLDGVVKSIHYKKGRFHDARSELSSTENESNGIGMETSAGRILVKQISGALARRIVCDCEVGDELSRGQVLGMIKLGSRTEIYLPADAGFASQVQVGDRVRAGVTILGEIP
jgi:phosphatidylserine decarboxylase